MQLSHNLACKCDQAKQHVAMVETLAGAAIRPTTTDVDRAAVPFARRHGLVQRRGVGRCPGYLPNRERTALDSLPLLTNVHGHGASLVAFFVRAGATVADFAALHGPGASLVAFFDNLALIVANCSGV
jgi:hypothetical protein